MMGEVKHPHPFQGSIWHSPNSPGNQIFEAATPLSDYLKTCLSDQPVSVGHGLQNSRVSRLRTTKQRESIGFNCQLAASTGISLF